MKTQKLLSDEKLIEMYVSGDNDAFAALLERYKGRVYTYIYCNVRNRDVAEDIFQDTFIKAITVLKQGRYNENGKFLAWVNRIAHNLIADYFRKEQNDNVVQCDQFGYDLLNNAKLSDTCVEDDMIHNQIISDVTRLVESLPNLQREAIRMRYYDNMSYKEIADQLGISINTALGRMRYAVLNMRRIAEEKEMELSFN